MSTVNTNTPRRQPDVQALRVATKPVKTGDQKQKKQPDNTREGT
jgi:hypothetical protein